MDETTQNESLIMKCDWVQRSEVILSFLSFPSSPSNQGVKQHNAAAYVLNKTVSKHRPAALAGTTSAAKVDGLNPNADAVAVRLVVYLHMSSFHFLELY